MQKSILAIGIAGLLAAPAAMAAPEQVSGVPFITHNGSAGCTSWQFSDQDGTQYMVWTGDKYPPLTGPPYPNPVPKVSQAVQVLLAAAFRQTIIVTVDFDAPKGICHGKPAYFIADMEGSG